VTVPATSRIIRTFDDRADALAHFFQRAGEAPRLVAYDDTIGCPLDQALAALEWTSAVGILHQDDLVHAARLSAETAAAVVEDRKSTRRNEGTLLYDEPGVLAYIFAQRNHELAHLLRASPGQSAAISLLGRRAPELRHIRRWTEVLFAEPSGGTRHSSQLLAGWFATGSAGYLFLAPQPGGPYTYCEVGVEG